MKQLLEQFENLNARERYMVIAAAVIVGLFLLYVAIWLPAHARVERMEKSVQEQRQLLQWMKTASAEAVKLRTAHNISGAPKTGSSLLALVDQTAKSRKLGPALKRIEPKGEGSVRVQLENAVFDDMITWLDSLQRSYGVTVDTVTLDKQDAPGKVTVNLILKGAG